PDDENLIGCCRRHCYRQQTFIIRLSHANRGGAFTRPYFSMNLKTTMQSFANHSTPTSIEQLLGILTIGQPTSHRSLAVYPLKADRHVAAVHYLVLDDAIKSGAFRITEVSAGGSVPQLRAINETTTAVFLLDGEQLIGAKQNRVLNLSVMLAAKSETEIPVA